MSFFEKYTQDEVRVIVAEKDAEIQRLKAELDLKENSVRDLCTIVRSKNKLITELADWVRDHSYEGYPLPNIQLRELLQRAREATK
jgi:hypothetical protein